MGKRIAILGSTGSIGRSALQVIQNLGPSFRAQALSANQNASLLAEQARTFGPAAVALASETNHAQLAAALDGLSIQLYRGPSGLVDLVRRDDVDIVLAAVVGAAGLPAVIAAIRAGKRIALANKETLVIAGSLIMPEVRRAGIQMLPVDSEHSAIFQAAQCGRMKEIHRVILTASGGPFRTATLQQMQAASLEQALDHPTWDMGAKITIDSATMFNKSLEIIEACWLFDLAPEKVQVVVHPESIIHSMVEFIDGSVIAQLSPPDMRTPIQYALTWPDRVEGIGRRLRIDAPFDLAFHPPDPNRFPAIDLAYRAVRAGGTMGAVLNAANETAVAAFIGRRIPLTEISQLVALTMAGHTVRSDPDLDDLLDADRWARQFVEQAIVERFPASHSPVAPAPAAPAP